MSHPWEILIISRIENLIFDIHNRKFLMNYSNHNLCEFFQFHIGLLTFHDSFCLFSYIQKKLNTTKWFLPMFWKRYVNWSSDELCSFIFFATLLQIITNWTSLNILWCILRIALSISFKLPFIWKRRKIHVISLIFSENLCFLRGRRFFGTHGIISILEKVFNFYYYLLWIFSTFVLQIQQI